VVTSAESFLLGLGAGGRRRAPIKVGAREKVIAKCQRGLARNTNVTTPSMQKSESETTSTHHHLASHTTARQHPTTPLTFKAGHSQQ